ncbi:MAG: sel1 repeat family protein [Rhodospirillaceae bacterium]|nr:sel1 repeat family protein [Rhodospirillaceae bacterium]
MEIGMAWRFIRSASLLLILLGTNSTTLSAGMDEALAAFSAGDYTATIEELEPLAGQGDPRAKLLLGRMYFMTANGDQSKYRDSFELLLPFAEAGDPDLQLTLGVMYHNGFGVERDYGQALYWLRKSADQGYVDAYPLIGEIYADGEGVAKDKTEAARWYLLSANAGDIRGQYGLGILHMRGNGVVRDLVLAHRWLRLSAAGGYDRARQALRELTESITPKQIAEAKGDGADWLEQRDDKTKQFFADFHDLEKLLHGPEAAQ